MAILTCKLPLGNVYVAEYFNGTVRKITPSGKVTTLAGLTRVYGNADGTGSEARFNGLQSVAVDSAGAVYVTERGHIRKGVPALLPLPPVNLSLQLTNNQVNLRWVDTSARYILEANTNLNATNWQTVRGTWSATNFTNTVTVPVETGANYFRLRQP